MDNLTRLDVYEKSAKRISRSILPAHQIDASGNDREDYEHQLLIKSWEAQVAFRTRNGFCTPAESRYVHACLWNSARNARRDARWLECRKSPLDYVPQSRLGVDPIEQIEARDLLRVLRVKFTEEEWGALSRVAMTGGNVVRAHEEHSDGTLAAFRRRVSKLRNKAREILSRNSSRKLTFVG